MRQKDLLFGLGGGNLGTLNNLYLIGLEEINEVNKIFYAHAHQTFLNPCFELMKTDEGKKWLKNITFKDLEQNALESFTTFSPSNFDLIEIHSICEPI